MGAVTPDGEIKILSGVPLAPDYHDTIAFNSKADQSAYFAGKAIYTMQSSSYQCYTRTSMRVKKVADELYNANYLMFKNTAFGSKWFYAFVTGVTFINNITTQVDFVIDVMQTYLFDWDALDTLVERETPASDGWRDNILAENFSAPYNAYTMEYITPSSGSEVVNDDYAYAVARGKDTEGHTATPGLYANCPNAVSVRSFDTFASYSDLIKGYNDADIADVVFTTVIPKSLHNWCKSTAGNYWTTQSSELTKYIVFDITQLNHAYTSTKWTKTRIYPYQSLVCVFGNQVMEFAPDGFTGDARFKCTYTFSGNPSLVIHPLNYIDDTIYMESVFPVIPIIGDFYRQYSNALAQNKASTVFNALSSAMSGGAFAGFKQLVQGELNAMRIDEERTMHPPTVSNYSADYSGYIDYRLFPKFYIKRLKSDYAHALDDQLTLTGYNTRRIKKFAKGRGKYHFVQTDRCRISPTGVPADAVDTICKIHDKGITYWDSGINVGNY